MGGHGGVLACGAAPSCANAAASVAARGVPPRTWIAKRPPLARMALAADDGVRMLKETNACGCSESVLKLLNVMPRHTLGVEVAAEEEAAEEEAEDEVVRITTAGG